MTTDTNISVTVTEAAALVGAERDGLEQVGGAVPGQRPGGLAGLAHVLVPDEQDQAAGVLAGLVFGPHAAQRAAQPRRELVPAVHHLGDGDPIGQVQVGAPAGRRRG